MNRHLAIVSAAFTWGGVLLGLPSLSVLLYFLWTLVGLRRNSPSEHPGSKLDPNSLVGLLVGAAQLAGKALKWFVASAEWAFVLLSVFSALLLVVAITLFAVGRGLQAHQTWARILGILLASALLLASAASTLMLRQGPAVGAASAVAVLCMYILWALWREFA